MLSIRIVALGKLRQRFIQEGEAEYLGRLKRSAKVELRELDTDRFSKLSEEEQKRREAELVLNEVKSSDLFCALDEGGRSFSSEEFALHLQQLMNRGTSRIIFAIGGPYGWDDSIRKRAQLLLSLSPMTFTYQMTRLVLSEQLYRALSILGGTPYHKV